MHENQSPTEEWFASWFDSPYYPMLYRHRNEIEARDFLHKLHGFLQLHKEGRILDLACGQGRHSRTLNALGYSVVGLDLSPASIAVAMQLSSSGQTFQVADMRDFELNQSFDAVFNLFTSFGYFNDEHDNARVLASVYRHLKPGGVFVLDYLNAFPLLESPEVEQTVVVDEVTFRTRKYRDGKCIAKDITIDDRGRVYSFKERVQLFTQDDLVNLLTHQGFQVERVMGNYALEAFEPTISPRCLIIARK